MFGIPFRLVGNLIRRHDTGSINSGSANKNTNYKRTEKLIPITGDRGHFNLHTGLFTNNRMER